MNANISLFSGSAHPFLAKEIASLLGIPLGKRNVRLFPDREIFVEIQESVEGRDVFVLQSLGENPSVDLMELLIMLDALKRAEAGSITAVLPYYPYARQDRIDRPGVPITAKLVADLLTQAGATRLITMDLHSEQIEGFFNMPCRHLLSRKLLIPYCAALNLDNMIAAAPDKGGIKIATAYAKALDLPIALIDKERIDSFQVVMRLFLGDVKDKTVLLVDDLCSTGGTLVNAAEVCEKQGAERIIAVIGHGVFIDSAIEKIENSPIEMCIVTNSVLASERVRDRSKFRVVSAAPLFAEAML